MFEIQLSRYSECATSWTIEESVFDIRQGKVTLLHSSRAALAPTKSLTQGDRSLFPLGKNGRGLKLTTYLHRMLRSREV